MRVEYDAYAPEPIVFETSLNGRSRGKGATWDCLLRLAKSEQGKKVFCILPADLPLLSKCYEINVSAFKCNQSKYLNRQCCRVQ